MKTLGHTAVSPEIIKKAAEQFGTPIYLYDEQTIQDKIKNLQRMPNAYGLGISYAMKANSSRALLQLITSHGLDLDTSSLNEARRAYAAGIPLNRMELTTQDVLTGQDRTDLHQMMLKGLKFNVCSRRQLETVADFAAAHQRKLSMRIHPGVGAGETVTRNTGDKYSCFGVHLQDLHQVLELANAKGLIFDQVHVHIGSGGDPTMWRDNIDRELSFVEKYFPDATTVNLGGGFKEARMPDEEPANIQELGEYARDRFENFYKKTGRKLKMQIEPGTYVIANAGFLLTRVLDKKSTGDDGFNFIVTNGGMEANTRPLLYGSRHPFYVVKKAGELLSSEFDLGALYPESDYRVVVGRCCESGDSQSLDSHGHIIPRMMASPDFDDYLVIGGCGAYVASMTLANYNSYFLPAEVLHKQSGELLLIRKAQTLEQVVQNELNY